MNLVMKVISYIITIFIQTTTVKSFALSVVQDSVIVKDCIVTPQIWSLEAPEKFSITSELRRDVGSSVFVNGKSIIILGRVLDRNCTPITGANIRIWQKNLGEESLSTDKTIYTGSSVSDNMGNFSFYTMMPVAEKNESSRIHFNVMHQDITDFETIMLFPKNKNDDEDLKDLKLQEKNLLIAKYKNSSNNNEVPVYEFIIIVEDKISYKHY